MENKETHPEDRGKTVKPIEHDYAQHENDPGPSPEAVFEYDKEGASKAMKWIIPVLIVILLIVYWIVFY
ncbi:hypothetical protein AAKU52_001797 [Pedobacter sp. CG_S7]|uniref:hypothetical protein n=1 Tax=Pedobacter sp. CG_S7 TaxID=3143930 RepID=UPI0033998203